MILSTRKRRKKKMQIAKYKTMASLIALLLMLTIAASLVALPTVNAAVNYYTSQVYVSVSRDVIGVGQQMLLVMWTADIPPDIGEQAIGGRAVWYNVGINVTKPDGTTETFIIPKTDPVGGSYVTYTPTTVGTYYLQAFFPETWKNTTANQYLYSAGKSIKLPFTVQQAPIQTWPESPLPNGYWTRPISQTARDWYVLTGDWLGTTANVWPRGSSGGNTQRFIYSTGPESAHILWTKPLWAGGIMTADYGNIGYETSHYQGVGFSPLILEGKIYYAYTDTAHSTQGYLCVDLYTGETLYYRNDTMPSVGQIYNYESPNQHGGFPYLWRTSGVTLPEVVQVPRVIQTLNNMSVIYRAASTTINRTATPYAINQTGTLWEMLDGHTGEHVTYIANVSSGGTAVYGKDGSILRYNTANLQTNASLPANYRLTVWNASYGTMPSSQFGTGAWQWRPMGGTFGGTPPYLGGVARNYVHDGNVFWSLNVSIPSLIQTPSSSLLNQTATIRAIREDEYVIFGTAGRNDERGAVKGWLMAVSLKGGQEGQRLWESTFTPPMASLASNVTISLTGIYPEDGVILFESSKLLKRWGYDMTTGALLWESEREPEQNYYSMADNVYEGKLLTTGFGGIVLAYNMTTGKIVWNFTAAPVGFESPYGNYPINIFAIADGKIYTLTGEHSISQPMFRGPNLRCINASNGVELWNLLNFGANGGASLGGIAVWLAEGKVVGLNYFDNQIYCIGIGKSATTVSAPQTAPALGSSVTITGTVTDQTPTGRRTTNDIIDWTLKDTPAISDADMGRWMEYMFQQQIFPSNAKGVEVTLDAIDPNNNYIHIGTVTSDVSGHYGISWTPEVPGTYQIIATFAGSKAYGSSFSETYMTVGPAPPEPITPEPEPPLPPFEMYTLYATIAIIIAVAIATLLLLRKK